MVHVDTSSPMLISSCAMIFESRTMAHCISRLVFWPFCMPVRSLEVSSFLQHWTPNLKIPKSPNLVRSQLVDTEQDRWSYVSWTVSFPTKSGGWLSKQSRWKMEHVLETHFPTWPTRVKSTLRLLHNICTHQHRTHFFFEHGMELH